MEKKTYWRLGATTCLSPDQGDPERIRSPADAAHRQDRLPADSRRGSSEFEYPPRTDAPPTIDPSDSSGEERGQRSREISHHRHRPQEAIPARRASGLRP